MNIQKIVSSLLACIALTLILASYTGEKTAGYTVEGKLVGIDSGMVKLVRYNKADRTSITVDSAYINKGKFTMKGIIGQAEMMNVMIVPGNWSMSIFMENSPIKLEVDTLGAQHYDYTAYGHTKGANLVNYTVSGSKANDQYQSYTKDPKQEEFNRLSKAREERYEKADEKERQKIKAEAESLYTSFTQWKAQWIDNFIAKNPSSVVGAYIFEDFYQFNRQMPLTKMEALLTQFKGEALSSPYYLNLKENLKNRKALLPGNEAPDFSALYADSTNFNLSSTRGKYVLIDFWASWCAPCRASIPHWKNVYAEYKDKGLEIVAVTNDNNWTQWKKALEVENMPWIQVADDFPIKNMPSRIGTLYMTTYLPSYVLLDPEGKIILHIASKEEITAEIKARLD